MVVARLVKVRLRGVGGGGSANTFGASQDFESSLQDHPNEIRGAQAFYWGVVSDIA